MAATVPQLLALAARLGVAQPPVLLGPSVLLAAPTDLAAANSELYPGVPGYITFANLTGFAAVALVRGGGAGSLGPPPEPEAPPVFVPNGGGGMPSRAIFEFSGPSGEQWSEDWWTNQSLTGGPPAIADAMRTARLALLAGNNIWRRVRWVSTDANRITAITDMNLRGDRPTDGSINSPRDLALVIRIQCDAGASRLWWCRGVSNGDWSITSDGIHSFEAGFRARARAFIGTMRAQGWGVRKLTPTALRVPFVTNILSVDGSTQPGLALISTAGAHGLAANDEVILYRTSQKDLPSLRGHWQVATVPTASSFTIPYRVPRDAGPVATSGFVRKAVYDAIRPFVDALPILKHVGHHDTKESFFGSRGSRRAGRLRQSL